MINLQFSFGSLAEFTAFTSKLAGVPESAAAAQPERTSESAPVSGAIPAAADPAFPAFLTDSGAAILAPKRRGRSPRVAATEVSPQAPVQTPAVKSAQNAEPAGETPTAAPTDSDVRQALQRLCEKHGDKGLQEVSKFIGSFGVQRVSELKPEQYADVIARVAEAVK